jgi:hypothetical protein
VVAGIQAAQQFPVTVKQSALEMADTKAVKKSAPGHGGRSGVQLKIISSIHLSSCSISRFRLSVH